MDEVIEAPPVAETEAAETSALTEADLGFLAKSTNVNRQSQK